MNSNDNGHGPGAEALCEMLKGCHDAQKLAKAAIIHALSSSVFNEEDIDICWDEDSGQALLTLDASDKLFNVTADMVADEKGKALLEIGVAMIQVYGSTFITLKPKTENINVHQS